MKSFPKARKAALFQRVIVNARRREQAAAPAPPSEKSRTAGNRVREQQMKIQVAFEDKDAA